MLSSGEERSELFLGIGFRTQSVLWTYEFDSPLSGVDSSGASPPIIKVRKLIGKKMKEMKKLVLDFFTR